MICTSAAGKELREYDLLDMRGAHFCSYKFVEISVLVCVHVCLFYLSRLFTGCLEFGLLAGLFDLLVLRQAVGVLRVHRVIFLS